MQTRLRPPRRELASSLDLRLSRLSSHPKLIHVGSLTTFLPSQKTMGELWCKKTPSLASTISISPNELEVTASFVTFVLPCGILNTGQPLEKATAASIMALRNKLFDSGGTLFNRLLSINNRPPTARRALILAFPVSKPRLVDSPHKYIRGSEPVACAIIDYAQSLYPEPDLTKGSAELQIFTQPSHRNLSIGTAMLHHAASLNYFASYALQPLKPRYKRFLVGHNLKVYDTL